MNAALQQLTALSLAAHQHALEHHGAEISSPSLESCERVDRILDIERERGSAEFQESLTLCYGAWLGEYLRTTLQATWTGLHEPVPPRVQHRGVHYSPLDAVRRRLQSERAPSIATLLEQCQKVAPKATAAVEDVNRSAWDARGDDPRFASNGALPENRAAAQGAVDPWLMAEGPLEGRNVLCLAAGGGTHGPLHALAGADVTVVDFSDVQLQRDRAIAQHAGLTLKTVQASMDDLSVLQSGSFDAVLHPVSLCYVPDVVPVYREIARVLKTGGLYISQQKQAGSQQAALEPAGRVYNLESPAEAGFPLPPTEHDSPLREKGAQEFVHPLGTLLGGLCASGFVIESLQEPPRGDAWAPPGTVEHRARFLPPYLKIKARRI